MTKVLDGVLLEGTMYTCLEHAGAWATTWADIFTAFDEGGVDGVLAQVRAEIAREEAELGIERDETSPSGYVYKEDQ